jgi:hypothetical protein
MSTNVEGTPIVIRQTLYDYLANKAHSKDITIKKHANDLLLTVLKRYAFLERRYPKLKVDAVGSGFLMLQDHTNNKKVETVVVKVTSNGEVECLSHKGQMCDHVKYACMSPDINGILVPEDITESEGAEDHNERNTNKSMIARARLIH